MSHQRGEIVHYLVKDYGEQKCICVVGEKAYLSKIKGEWYVLTPVELGAEIVCKVSSIMKQITYIEKIVASFGTER